MTIKVIRDRTPPGRKPLGMVGPGGLFRVANGDTIYIKGVFSTTCEVQICRDGCIQTGKSLCTSIPNGSAYLFENTKEVYEYDGELTVKRQPCGD